MMAVSAAERCWYISFPFQYFNWNQATITPMNHIKLIISLIYLHKGKYYLKFNQQYNKDRKVFFQ